jgi:signal transduction histidine kinase
VRNPLAGLRASLQVLDGRTANAGDRDIIAAMIQRIDGLNDKVNDLLLYARPKAPSQQALEIRPILRETAASARAAIGSGVPAVDIHAPDGLRVCADPDMLRAAILNLVMNACQAGGRSPIEITCSVEGSQCRIAIADRGPGIPEDVRDRVFEPFFTTRTSGTGLGLAIVRRLVDLQEGTVALHDRPGGGTVAEVTIPLARAQR